MKAVLIFLLISGTFAFGEPLEITLNPNKEDNRDYGKQLIEKFNNLLKSDRHLKEQFSLFEKTPKERAGGRYSGSTATSLLLHHSVNVDFKNTGGKRDYKQTVVLYYSFSEGHRKGMEVTTGVFAVFQITGHQTYSHKGGDEFELLTHTVTAEFDGFQKMLNAERSRATR